MNIQPNSQEISKYIELEQYFALLSEQRHQSYIGSDLSIWADAALRERLTELEDLEEKGFIFLGEKNWLLKFVENNRTNNYDTYDKWVIDNFQEYLGLTFVIDEGSSIENDKMWKAEISAADHIHRYHLLINPAYHELKHLELFVTGDCTKPSAMHICSLFESLHILQYTIASLSHDSRGYEPSHITGIEVSNKINPHHIWLNIVSEYGSEFNGTAVLGKGWRHC